MRADAEASYGPNSLSGGGGTPADDPLLLLVLAVVYQIPVFAAAMACTWLVHEFALHRWTRLSKGALATRAFWTQTLWDHPPRFLITYVILFIAFLALFQLPGWFASGAANAVGGPGLGGPALALLYAGGLFALGLLALRSRLRSHMA